MRLPFRAPFDGEMVLDYVRTRALPGVESAHGDGFRRIVRLRRGLGTLEIRGVDRTGVDVVLRVDDPRDRAELERRTRALLDLDADAAAMNALLGRDTLIAKAVARQPGLRVPGAVDGFELAVRAILGQQVSVAGARTLAARIVRAIGTPIEHANPQLTHAFPTPQMLAGANLDGLGITGGRIRALRSLAAAIASGALSLERGVDLAATENALVALPGIGPWTASYIAMRALGDRDAMPIADLGVKKAFERAGLSSDVKSIAAYAERWRPYRAYATLYLWRTL